MQQDIDGLVEEKRNFIVNAAELRVPCTNPSLLFLQKYKIFLHRPALHCVIWMGYCNKHTTPAREQWS